MKKAEHIYYLVLIILLVVGIFFMAAARINSDAKYEAQIAVLSEGNNDLTLSLEQANKQRQAAERRARWAEKKAADMAGDACYLIYTGEYEITYYTPADPGVDFITATGTTCTAGRTIAADPQVIPYGTEVYISGIGWRVVEDRGGAIKGKKIDVYVDSTKDIPAAGRESRRVWIKKNGGIE